MSPDGEATAWVRPRSATAIEGFERRAASAVNAHDTVDRAMVELNYRHLVELHIIRVILVWTMIIVPALLVVVAIIIGVALGEASTPVTPTITGF